jgi:uncharacterized membrane protein YccC
MTYYERGGLVVAAIMGSVAIWYYIGSVALAWAFLAGAIILGECVDVLARRLNQIIVRIFQEKTPLALKQ